MKYSATSIPVLIKTKNVEALKAVLTTLSSFEIANIIGTKDINSQVFIFQQLEPELAAKTFEFLPHKTQIHILSSLPSTQAATLLMKMFPDDRTAMLQQMSRPVIDECLNLLSPEERTLAVTLLGYPENSVGRLMTPDYLAVKMEWTLSQVLTFIRENGRNSETIDMIYVVDDKGKLLDDIQIRKFLLYPPEYTVSQIADNKFIALSAFESSENAINLFKKNDRVALPVISPEGIIQGIVTIDDILRLASQKNTANIQRIGGTEPLEDSYMQTPFFDLIKKRARWLVVLFIGELFTATAMGFFEEEISKAVVLALFLPLIISSGGNAGSQSSTLIIRAMALGEVKLKDWWRIMKWEIISGASLGLILGIVGFVRVTIWSEFSDIYGEHWLLVACTIFASLIGVVLWGSLSGAMLPFILRRAGADPATSSAPLVATIVDVTGIVIYFCIAMWLLKGTLL